MKYLIVILATVHLLPAVLQTAHSFSLISTRSSTRRSSTSFSGSIINSVLNFKPFQHHKDQIITKTDMAMTNTINEDECNSKGIFLLSNIEQLAINGPKRLILASQSPRRREILDMMGLKDRYITNPSPLDESKLQEKLSKMRLRPQEYTKILAEEKANALAEELVSSNDNDKQQQKEGERVTFVLGSDTIVDLNGNILEKPTSHENAIDMLTKLSGQWHEVHTGVALYRVHSSNGHYKVQLETSYTETSRVKFSTLSIKDIECYVQTGEPMDKAGSYGIQVRSIQYCCDFCKTLCSSWILSEHFLSI